tara:strand:+ start:4603 stop:5088 length:486 start_codon:yes stop_codon:yes gene_type:complete
MAFNIDGKLGVKLTETISDTSLKRFTIGECVQSQDNSKYMYVRAASSVGQYDAVTILSDNTVAPLTTANASVSRAIGFAQTSIASASFGWVALNGNKLLVNCAANCEDAVMLFTTGTAGVLDDATVTLGAVAGVLTLTTISNATAVTAIMAYPHITHHLMA